MLSDLGPGSFAFVMATGIVSVGASYEGLPALSDALLGVAAGAYVLLAVLVLSRRPSRPGFEGFAFVAATGVLASRLLVAGRLVVPLVLLGATVVSWLVVAARLRPDGRPRGTWLLAVVATQSVAVVTATVAGRLDSPALLDAATAVWVLGLALYPALAVAVTRSGRRIAPDHWILMGALAISALAAGQVAGARPALGDAALAVWAAASALVVPLAAAHLLALVRRSTAPGSPWTLVFPLGMYAVASVVDGNAVGPHALVATGHAFFWGALAAWAAVAATTLGVRMLPPWPSTAPSRSSTSARRPVSRSSAPPSSSS